MIHKALLGSIERFMSVYIEHTAGRFPVWLAPEQLRILTVNQEEKTTGFAEKILEKAKQLNVRAMVDNQNESVGKKIRQAQMQKIPYVIVIGDKEIESGEVMPRIRSDMEVQKNQQAYDVDNFLKTIKNEMVSRVSMTSL
jgi:threonyl-tRNA synthetase